MDLASFAHEDEPDNNKQKVQKKSSKKSENQKEIEKILKIKISKKSNKQNLLKIKEVMAMFPGTYPVILSLPTNGKHKEVRLTDKINICPALIDNLSQIVSRNSIITT